MAASATRRPQMHPNPTRQLSPRTQRRLSCAVAIAMGLALAELLAQWAMGTGVA
jgi:hypothetical protein